jgi:serine/threonine protein kinase
MVPAQIGNWLTVCELGRGGQGVVYKVKTRDQERARQTLVAQFLHAIRDVDQATSPDALTHLYESVDHSLAALVAEAPAASYAAAKVLHFDRTDRSSQAKQRFAMEIEALTVLKGRPGILELLDSNLDAGWMVTRFCSGGTLANSAARFKNNALASLRALRPVIAAVTELHARQFVHRDIKTANILIDEYGELVLGDFGIVFKESDNRPTEQLERVGSRDWMPPWYQTGGRVEDVKPDFDVYALGKVLWSMVAGRGVLPLWYWDRDQYKLENLVDADLHAMKIVNRLLASTVVEDRNACLSSAAELLVAADNAITQLGSNGSRFHATIRRRCIVCRQGDYVPIRNGKLGMLAFPDRQYWRLVKSIPDLYTSPESRVTLRLERCEHCGHVEFFSFKDGDTPPAWVEDGHPRRYDQ